MKKEKTSIVFTGDIGFDRYMDRKWEDENLLSQGVLDFFHSADHVCANVEGALIDAVDDGSRGVFFHAMNPEATKVFMKMRTDIWSIGNNHTMDAGGEGVASTRKIAADLGVKTIGAGMNVHEASEPVYLDVKPNDAPSSVIFERMNLSSFEKRSRTSVDLCWLSES